MANPIDVEQVRQIKDDAFNHLLTTEEIQRQRWDTLRGVADDAALRYTTMRIDAIEESLREQGAPLWLSVILAVGMSFIPVSALAGTFFTALTKSTQKLLTASDRALLASSKTIALREQDVSRALTALNNWRRLPGEMLRTEEMVARFGKAWESELVHIMQEAVQGIGDTIGTHMFEQETARKLHQTDVPAVVVKRALRKWIETQVRAEGIAREMLRGKISDLFAIAISPDPAKVAKEKEKEAEKKEAVRNGTRDSRKPVEKLPKTNKEALEQLTQQRDDQTETDAGTALYGCNGAIAWFTAIHHLRWSTDGDRWSNGNNESGRRGWRPAGLSTGARLPQLRKGQRAAR